MIRFRSLPVLAAVFIILAATPLPASACQGVQFETHVMFAGPPDAEEGQFVGKLSVEKRRRFWVFTQPEAKGYRAKVLHSDTHPGLVGTYILLPRIMGTSCGPWLEAGSKGWMFGNFSGDAKPGALLQPGTLSGMAAFGIPSDSPSSGTPLMEPN